MKLHGANPHITLQRSHALSGVETEEDRPDQAGHTQPSTKPRPFRRGDTPEVTMILVTCAVLQRSHALSGVETASRRSE